MAIYTVHYGCTLQIYRSTLPPVQYKSLTYPPPPTRPLIHISCFTLAAAESAQHFVSA